VPTDVTDPDAVENLARKAVENFGRIHIWVNNAAVSLFARLEEVPLDAYRRVIETNPLGTVHGARAALWRFREQGGVLGGKVSYSKGRSVPGDEGELVAAFDGNHGWFWRNRGSAPVTVKLTASGEFGTLKQAK
jgi:NAD(P)-dependent dehydrogenase (short-subunit alcohol dehydrogenase family)